MFAVSFYDLLMSGVCRARSALFAPFVLSGEFNKQYNNMTNDEACYTFKQPTQEVCAVVRVSEV